MASYYNIYSPMTQEGRAMSNAVDAFFLSGSSPQQRADREALARLRDEKVNTELALQDKYRAQIDQLKAQETGLSNFLPNFVASIPGVSEPQANMFFDTGEIPQMMTEGPPEMTDGVPEYPTIDVWGPETSRDLEAGRRLYALMLASDRSKLTPQGMSEGLGDVQGQYLSRDFLRGDVDPTMFAISQGKLPYSQSGGRSINEATGDIVIDDPTRNRLQSQTDLDLERINTEKARQGSLTRRADAAVTRANAYANKQSTAQDKPPPKINSSDRKDMRRMIREQLTYEAGYEAKDDEGEPIFLNVPPQIENEILDIAEQMYRDRASIHYGNARSAIMEAITIVSPGGWEMTGEKGWGQRAQEFLGFDTENPDFIEGSEAVIKRPGAPSVMQPPRGGNYYDADGESYTVEEINQEAREQGVTPQEIIEAYGLTPGA